MKYLCRKMWGKRLPRLLTPRETILEQDRTLTLEDKGGNGKYYVYVKGDVVYTTDQVADAITKANEKMGVVVGEDQGISGNVPEMQSNRHSLISQSARKMLLPAALLSVSMQCLRKKELISVSVH